MHRPELLILDEPTAGLDPLVQQEFYRIIETCRAGGCTAFVSSHNLPEVERLCDRVGIIREGRLVDLVEVASLKERALRRLEVRFASPPPLDAFSDVPGILDLRVDGSVFHCTVKGNMDAVIKTIARYEVVNVISHEPSLEEVFLTYYGGGEAGAQ